MRSLRVLALALWVCACGAPRVSPDSHGVSVLPGPCGRGLVVLESDYQSSNVSLLDFAGNVLTPSLTSSSTVASGFAVSLGSDAVPPSSLESGSRIVLIDRFPAGVLHFVDLASGNMDADLPVGTGFKANPQDYLQLAEHKAYVPRYNSNHNPGQQAWDAGGDLLLVDPTQPEIVGRIDLSMAMVGEPPNFSAHPAQVVQVAGRVFALLASYADDLLSGTTSRLVEIDPASDSLLSTLLLDGLRGCVSLAASPDQGELAVACLGDGLASKPPRLTSSGVALVDITDTPRFRRHFNAADWGANPVGFGLDYAAPGVLLINTLGYLEPSGDVGALDTLLRLDTASAQVDEVLRAEAQPFTLGAVRCAPTCGACFVPDARRAGGSVLRLAVDDAGNVAAPMAIRAETQIGLPPRYLSVF